VDPRRLSTGEWIAAVSGIALVVSLFLPWYSVAGHDATAWQSMSVDDALLAFAGLAAVAAAVATAAHPGNAVPVVYVALSGFAGLLAVILAVWRVLDPAPSGDVSLEIGAWLGLAAALGIAMGACFGMRDEGPARRSEEAARLAAEAARKRAETLSVSSEGGVHS
jgi:hypothetical protein